MEEVYQNQTGFDQREEWLAKESLKLHLTVYDNGGRNVEVIF
jgi:hypothetical protein